MTQTTGTPNKPMDDCSFDLIMQAEKKADFIHSAVEKYIRDANEAKRPELASLWETIRQDEQRHLDMLKQQLAKDVKEGRLR